jgi:uracil-DNA glycosylase
MDVNGQTETERDPIRQPLRYADECACECALGKVMAEQIPPAIKTLEQLRAAEAECTRCPLYRHATQVVPGEGPSHAKLLVGEQPGDKEDLAGRPFVGPAGRILDAALADAGIPREETFVTNAVKHFKFEMRGKRRLHKRPNAYEIERCKWWNDLEGLIVKPEVVVALGATAARSLLGRVVTITKVRGEPIELHDGARLVVTIHPSALLRTEDETDKRAKYREFVHDLQAAAKLVFQSAA